MKRLLALLFALAGSVSLHAQTNGIDQPSDFLSLPTGEKFLRWDAKLGRSYFMQISDSADHLRKWYWAPVIEQGFGNDISFEVDGTAEKGFFRLKYDNQVPVFGDTLESSDYDGDGIVNWEEISPSGSYAQTDPLNADTDSDQMNDGFERANGFNPNNPDENSNSILDGLEDLDGDGILNGSDSSPRDFYNGAMPRLSVSGNLEVKVTGSNGAAISNAPVKFTRTAGTGSFPGSVTSLTRRTTTLGVISVADYSFGTNDAIKATLVTPHGDQNVWLPGGIASPSYGSGSGGGALVFTAPSSISPPPDVDDTPPDPDVVLPVQHYLKYSWKVEQYGNGYSAEAVPLTEEEDDGRTAYRYYGSYNEPDSNHTSVFTNPANALWEDFYMPYRTTGVDVTAKMGLGNLPVSVSKLKIQAAYVYVEDVFQTIVNTPAQDIELDSSLQTLSLTGPEGEAAMIFGPFLSGLDWDEMEADDGDSDVAVPSSGERRIQVQVLIPDVAVNWISCSETNGTYDKNSGVRWEISSSNPEIDAKLVDFLDLVDTTAPVRKSNQITDIILSDPEGAMSAQSTITLSLVNGSGTIIKKVFKAHLVPDVASKPKLVSSSQTNDEAAGPKYRKIGMTGVPLSDEKPQASEETDEEQEETYVDALTRELRHSTTDVYVPVPASELVLTVRRNVASEVWSMGSGLAPREDPTLAFGAGWRSNLGSHIRMVEQTDIDGTLVALMNVAERKEAKVGQSDPNYAFVTDETGSTHRFAIGYERAEGLPGYTRYFVPMPTSRNEQDAYQMALTYSEGSGFVFTRKYGNTLHFAGGSSIRFPLTADRIGGSWQYQDYQYFRLNSVADRFGNQLNYSYSGTQNLVPSTIAVAGRPDLAIRIIQSSQGRITAVYDPNGNATTYSYGGVTSLSSTVVLDSVSSGGQTVASYTYEEQKEEDYRKYATGSNGVTTILPWNRRIPAAAAQYEVETGHINVKSIADAYGRTTLFDYGYDKTYSIATFEETYGFDGERNGVYNGSYVLSGIPRNVTAIHLPGDRTVTIGGAPGSAKFGRLTTVTDAADHVRNYSWPSALTMMVDTGRLGYEFSETHVSSAKINYFTQMTLSHAEGGSESYSFHVNSGLSLQSVTDYSGNTTSYTHGKDLSGNALPPMASLFGTKLNLGALTYSEPTSQTDALNRTTRYAYGPYRVMTTSIGPDGVRTDNDVDSLGRRIKEEVRDRSDNILRKTEFAYHSNTVGTGFPDFLIRQTVRNTGLYAANDPSWVAEMTTLYEPDSNGRVGRQATDMNGNNVIDAGDLITSYTYDKSGNKLSATAPDGLTTWFQYDARHRLVKTIFPDGSHQDTIHDKSGRKVLSRDENGHASGFVYDDGGRLVKTVRDMNGNLAANVNATTVGSILTGLDAGTDLIEETAYTAIDVPYKKTDARGYVSVTEYDHLRRPTKTIAPGVSRAAGVVPNGTGDDLVTQLFYDGANSGASCFDQSGFKPTKVIDPRGYTTINLFDPLYRQIESRVQYQLSPERYARSVNSYDLATGNLTDTYAYRDPFNADGSPAGGDQRFSRTHTLYDALKRPTTVYQGYGTSLQSSVVTAYTSTGLAHQTTQQLTASDFAVSDSEYDVAGRATKVIGPAIPVFGGGSVRPITLTSYTPTGLKASVTDPRSFVTDFHYDARGRLVQTLQPEVYDAIGRRMARAVSTTVYDRVGNAIATIDPRGFQTDTTFDDANRVTDVYQPAVVPFGSTVAARPHTQTIYDLAGNILQLIDPNGNATVNVYDSLGRLATTKTNPTVVASSASHADDITVTNEYDKGGNLIQVSDGLGQVTRFEFDGLKRSTATVWDYGSSRARTVSTEYDAALKTASVDSRSWRTEFSYDERFRLTSSTCANRTDDNETWAYDLADRILSVNRTSSTDTRNVSYQYNAAGWITQETSTGITTLLAYDVSGNRRLVTYPLGARQLVTTFDKLNRVLDITETKPGVSGERKTAYFYDLSGNRVRNLQPNGSEELTEYDGLSRKTSLLTRHYQSEDPVSRSLYQYDLGSSVRQISEDNASVPDRIVANSYDRVYRLTNETATTGSKVETSLFVYDKAHNRTGRTRTVQQSGSLVESNSDTFTYGNATNGKNSNQLTLYHDAKRNVDVTYSYDLNGNRYQRLENGSPTHTYVWDSRNRLIEATAPGGTSHYGYDYRTRRVLRDESTAGGTSTVITFSGGNSFIERASGTTTPVVEYIRGSDWGGGIGGILYTVRGGVSSHSAYNSRGDVVAKTDSTGSVTWQASYEAFGTRTAEQGTNADRQRANTKEEDPTGLLNEGFRYRDLETGLFISRDPAGFVDGPNVYTYVTQNPWTSFDPEGLSLKGFFVGVWEGMIMRELDRSVANADVGFTMAPLLLSPKGAQEVKEQRNNFVQKVDEAQAQIQVDNSKNFNVAADDAHRPIGQKVGAVIDENIDIVAASGFAAGNKVLRRSSVTPSQRDTVEYQQLEQQQQEGGRRPDKLTKEYGSYTNTHESGTEYHGQGDKQRSQQSGKERAAENNDPHTATDWTPAPSRRQAMKDEAARLEQGGGKESDKNYNKIESPGKKYKAQDGE